MGYVIAIDIGGTQLRAAVYASESRQPVQIQRIQTHAPGEKVFERLARLTDSVWPKDGTVEAIGVSAPGPLDPHTGVIMTTPNIKEWQNFPLVAELTARFKVQTFLANDANLAGLAEWRYGAGRGHHNVLYLTVSTGVGGGVIIDDRLLQGSRGLAAELGHVTLDASPDAPLCGCGFRGHLESFSSGTGIERFVADELAAGRASSLTGRPSARKIAEAALAGDGLARAAYARAGKYLGIAVANFLHIFDPSVVVFGGGVTMSGPLLFDSFDANLRARVFHPRYLEGLEIKAAELGDDAGLLGALALARLRIQD
ncbi:MAG: glucokinase [Anaerolineaceae bacterium]|nr:ROK family protein [Anaerolineae bacterium]MDL1926056.1 ROK family protein [Anaerolineae bacterium AMX1]WKZ53563.1 MAG: ROK family protein [Anaerolineales bacterium]GIK10533.1 MAG: glucokinase [Chloroflexota bacterium]GJQ37831.1 MAG: glucokinase [Anaerolineaceae bacterium]